MAKTGTTKLLDFLKAQISKKEDQKAIEAAERQVKTAKKAMTYEVSSADEAVDAAKDNLDAVLANPSSTGAQILEAQRAVALAAKNFEDLTAIVADRF